jgi:hypothetical protein
MLGGSLTALHYRFWNRWSLAPVIIISVAGVCAFRIGVP